MVRLKSGRQLPLFSLATPPRLEIFFWILLMPSAIFTTQAASTVSPTAASLAAWCLVLAFVLFLWGACWVILWKIIICKTIVFVIVPRRSRVSFFQATQTPGDATTDTDHLFRFQGDDLSYSHVGARRRSSRAGFVIEPETQARNSGWYAASLHCL